MCVCVCVCVCVFSGSVARMGNCLSEGRRGHLAALSDAHATMREAGAPPRVKLEVNLVNLQHNLGVIASKVGDRRGRSLLPVWRTRTRVRRRRAVGKWVAPCAEVWLRLRARTKMLSPPAGATRLCS